MTKIQKEVMDLLWTHWQQEASTIPCFSDYLDARQFVLAPLVSDETARTDEEWWVGLLRQGWKAQQEKSIGYNWAEYVKSWIVFLAEQSVHNALGYQPPS